MRKTRKSKVLKNTAKQEEIPFDGKESNQDSLKILNSNPIDLKSLFTNIDILDSNSLTFELDISYESDEDVMSNQSNQKFTPKSRKQVKHKKTISTPVLPRAGSLPATKAQRSGIPLNDELPNKNSQVNSNSNKLIKGNRLRKSRVYPRKKTENLNSSTIGQNSSDQSNQDSPNKQTPEVGPKNAIPRRKTATKCKNPPPKKQNIVETPLQNNVQSENNNKSVSNPPQDKSKSKSNLTPQDQSKSNLTLQQSTPRKSSGNIVQKRKSAKPKK